MQNKHRITGKKQKYSLRSSARKDIITTSLISLEQRQFMNRRLNELKIDAVDRLKKRRAANGGKKKHGDILIVINEINSLSKSCGSNVILNRRHLNYLLEKKRKVVDAIPDIESNRENRITANSETVSSLTEDNIQNIVVSVVVANQESGMFRKNVGGRKKGSTNKHKMLIKKP